MTGKLRGILGILVIGLAVLAGCGGTAEQDADPISGSDVLKATEAASTAKFAMTLNNATDHYTMDWSAEGAVDFANERGRADFTMAAKTILTPTSAGDFSMEELLPNGEMRAEARWIGDDAWIRMQPDVDEATRKSWDLPPAGKWLKSTSETDDEYVDCTVSGGAGFDVNGPPTDAARDMLETLRANGDVLDELGAEVVRGEPTTHWLVESPKLSPKCSEEDKATLTKVIVEVWTDADERARRILLTVEGKGYESSEKETASFSTDFYDFGTEVDVSPPPASEVVEEEPLEDEFTEHSVEGLEDGDIIDFGTPGEWTVAASGDRNGEPWRISVAKTSTGMYCYDAENVTDDQIETSEPTSMPKRDGRPTVCDGGPIPILTRWAFFALADIADDGQRVIVGRSAGDTAELTFADGTTQPMQVDSTTHLAQWRGAAPDGLVKITSDGQTCVLGMELDGEVVQGLGKDNFEFPCLSSYAGAYGTLETGGP